MKMSTNGIEVLEYCEACRLKAYPDPASPRAQRLRDTGRDDPTLSGAPWTIGWGDTGPDVVEGLVIDQAEADARLAKRLATEFEPGVEKLLRRPATQGQFDAMVDFAYNERLHALATSTLLSCFNRGLNSQAAGQFAAWNKAGGKVMLGLRRRRAMDLALWNGMTGAQAIAIGVAIH